MIGYYFMIYSSSIPFNVILEKIKLNAVFSYYILKRGLKLLQQYII